jgi:hypothetical protein
MVLYVCEEIKKSVDIPLVWDGVGAWLGSGVVPGYAWNSVISFRLSDCNPSTLGWVFDLTVRVECQYISGSAGNGTQGGSTRHPIECDGSWAGPISSPTPGTKVGVKLNGSSRSKQDANPLP